MIYKAAREVADEMSGITFSGPHQQVRGEISELISAKFAPLVEAVEKWRTDENLGECGCGTCTALREALEKIL